MWKVRDVLQGWEGLGGCISAFRQCGYVLLVLSGIRERVVRLDRSHRQRDGIEVGALTGKVNLFILGKAWGPIAANLKANEGLPDLCGREGGVVYRKEHALVRNRILDAECGGVRVCTQVREWFFL